VVDLFRSPPLLDFMNFAHSFDEKDAFVSCESRPYDVPSRRPHVVRG
jgi:hypothetical protein